MDKYLIIYEAQLLYDRITELDKLRELDKRISRCPVCNDWRFDERCTRSDKYDLPHCEWCNRPMRERKQKVAQFPHTVVRAAKGWCDTCYRKARYGGEDTMDKELDDAVESYWLNRIPILSGPINGND